MKMNKSVGRIKNINAKRRSEDKEIVKNDTPYYDCCRECEMPLGENASID